MPSVNSTLRNSRNSRGIPAAGRKPEVMRMDGPKPIRIRRREKERIMDQIFSGYPMLCVGSKRNPAKNVRRPGRYRVGDCPACGKSSVTVARVHNGVAVLTGHHRPGPWAKVYVPFTKGTN